MSSRPDSVDNVMSQVGQGIDETFIMVVNSLRRSGLLVSHKEESRKEEPRPNRPATLTTELEKPRQSIKTIAEKADPK